MAKFRKKIKIAPGININISKSGVSSTFGPKGASVNVGKKGAYLNTGIPGTGIYDRTKLGGSKSNRKTSGDHAAVDIPAVGKTGRRVLTVIGILLIITAIIFILPE